MFDQLKRPVRARACRLVAGARSSSPATASASARCTGRSRATGFTSAPRSRRCWPPAASSQRRSARARPPLHVLRHGARAARCFEGVQSVLPGHYLKIAFRRDGKRGRDQSSTATGTSTSPTPATRTIPPTRSRLIDEFEAIASPRRRGPAAGRRAGRRLPLRRRRFRLRGCDGLASCGARRFRASPSRCPARASTRPTRRSLIARHVGSRPTIFDQRSQSHRQHLSRSSSPRPTAR